MIRGGGGVRSKLPIGRPLTGDPADLDPIDAEDLSPGLVAVLQEAGDAAVVGAIPAGDVRRDRHGRSVAPVDSNVLGQGRHEAEPAGESEERSGGLRRSSTRSDDGGAGGGAGDGRDGVEGEVAAVRSVHHREASVETDDLPNVVSTGTELYERKGHGPTPGSIRIRRSSPIRHGQRVAAFLFG